jgi:non-lysosomal glucosylceramidase
MIDDGPWGGVPIGGIGAGSIGRTQRGDFARWHLRIGEHRFESVPVDGFSLWVDDGQTTSATVLRTTNPPPGWGPALPVAAGTYRALFPRAWIEYEPVGVPIRVVEEQLSPVIPGDDAATSLPLGAFEFELTNPLDRPVDAAVLLSWLDPLCGRSTSFAETDVAGVVFEAPDGSGGMAGTFAIAASSIEAEVTTSRFAPADGAAAWQGFATDGRAPAATSDGSPDQVGAVAVRVTLEPGATRTIRFAIAWDLPVTEFGGGRRWHKRYTREWGITGTRAVDLARHALTCAPEWQAAIERWQDPILAAEDRPDWYKAALFNELYFLVDGASVWPEAAVDPGPETDGLATLGIIECFDYPFYDTLDVHFYAASALARLWPSLQASISRAYARTVAIDDPELVTIQANGARAIRKVPGALPHDLGGPAEDPFVRVNHYTYQEVNGWKDLNPKFVLQAWRDRLLDGDPDGFVRDVWPTIPIAMDHLAAFDRDGDGLPEHDGLPDQTYDTWPMTGASAYGGSLWLAALRAAAAFARAAGDDARAAAWDADFERGQATFERLLWNGRSYDYDAGAGPTSDSVMADQLVGQWFADVCGLGDIVPPARARSALERIYELNVCDFGDGLLGAVNGMRPDGTVDQSSQQSQEVWVGTTYALAAFMIGRGLVAEGWTTAEGAARVVWERGLWFRTPEAYDRNGDYRAPLYLRPLAIWAIEEALERNARA